MDLAKLRAEPIAKIVPELKALDDGQLAELLRLEQEDKDPRKGLIEAIELDQAHRADRAREAADAASKTAPPPAEPTKPAEITAADYRHRDYVGPLTANQAAWRLANIKPVAAGVRTK